MKKFWSALFVFLLWAAFLIIHEYVSNSISGECATVHNQLEDHTLKKDKKHKTSDLKEISKTAFSIMTADGKSMFNFPKGFIINSKDGSIDIPNELSGFKDFIYNYLNANQGKELLISAKYLASEVNDENKTHLGNSRIEFLKSILIKAGINPDRIVPKTVLSEFSYGENGNYYDGISMLFKILVMIT